MPSDVLSGGVFALFLVFARLGAAFMLFPGFGEAYVGPRVRLFAALAVSLAVVPVVEDQLSPLPAAAGETTLLVLGEVLVGLFIGGAVRLLTATLQIAGQIMALQTALAAAQFFDPSQGTGGSLHGTFLTILGVLLIFVTNLHHPMLWALVDSYTLFPPGEAVPYGDFAETASSLVADAFRIALQLAAPIVAVTFLFNVATGLIARLIPQMQVFFIALPVQIGLGFVVLIGTLSAVMLWYLDRFEAGIAPFLVGR